MVIRNTYRIVAVILAFTCWYTTVSMAATRHVWSAGSGSSPYNSWTTAAQNIQAALNGSTAGDVILVTNGTYTSAATVIAQVTNAVTLRSVNGPAVTIIDAQAAVSTDRRCVRFMTTATGATISGFKLKGVYNTGNGYNGGAVYMESAVTVTNCIVENNRIGGRGAGVYMIAAGLVTDCVFTNNRATEWGYGYGGAVYMNNGTVQYCLMVSNSCWSSAGGGAVFMDNGVLQNCLIVRNRATRAEDNALGPGGGVRIQNGRMLHCTIARNWSKGLGGGLYQAGGSVTNCIIYDNTTASDNPYSTRNVYKTGGTISYSCMTPLVAGTGNTDKEPRFVDIGKDNCRLLPGSLGVDGGINLTGFTQDRDHSARPTDGDATGGATADMGCYEMPASGGRTFAVGFTASTNEWVHSAPIIFTASVVGTNTTINHYRWVFGDGTTNAGAGLGSVTHTFTTGWYTVSLTVTNALNETATVARTNYVRIAPRVAYVSPTGAKVVPYATLANAAQSIEAAVNVAYDGGTTATWVQVSSGTYTLTNPIPLNRGIAVRSAAGYSNTSLQVSGVFRCVDLSDPKAVLDGFRLRGPDNNTLYYWGGAARVRDGLLTNCWLRNTHIGGRGGALYQYGGTVSHCIFTTNWVHEWQYGYGGAAYVTAGLLKHSRFAHNYSDSYRGGGAIYQEGGEVRNCLFYTNRAIRTQAGYEGVGGAIRLIGGLVSGCTIDGNYSYGPGGGINMAGGAITNTIVYNNVVGAATPSSFANLYKTAGTISFSCTTPSQTGTGNTVLDPEFLNRSTRDYRIPAVSPCANVGTNLAWATGSIDLQGSNRVINGRIDIGAYESPDPSFGPLLCSFIASASEGFTNMTPVFTATVSGSNTNIVRYWWNYKNDASWDYQGPSAHMATNTYTSGYYTVKLMVSNSVGAVATSTKNQFIRVAPAVLYVATNGTPVPPYMTWASAALYLQDAVDAASSIPTSRSTVYVGPGTYTMSSQIGISKPLRLKGASGPSNCIIRSSGSVRCVSLAHTNAVLDGLMLTGANYADFNTPGGGVYLTAGLVTNCIIKNNRVGGRGGGVWLNTGLVTDSLFVSNRCTEWQYGYGGGAYVEGNGLIRNSRFMGNWTDSHRGGGAIYMNGGIVRNCLMYRNRGARTTAGSESDGGGVLLAGGLLENCTLANNTTAIDGGGIKIEGATGGMTNCIAYYNKATTGANNIWGTNRVGYSCSPDLAVGVKGNITAAPMFVNTNVADYTIPAASPCLDKGITRSWMVGTTDLDNRPRRQGASVEMGCYEVPLLRGSIFTFL